MDTATTKSEASWQVRPLAWEDLDAALALIEVCHQANEGELEYTRDDLEVEWRDLDLAQDSWAVEGPDGALIGYATLSHDRPSRYWTYLYIHPAYADQSLA